MADSNRPWIALHSTLLSAQVDPLGAQLSVLHDAQGKDLLWNGDAAFWPGRAPLLFPIVGSLAAGRYRLAGSEYPLSRHGFARGSRFQVRESAPDSALFVLPASEATRSLYPYNFELAVRFRLTEATLTIITEVRNRGEVPMPASFGYHPAFRWPLPYGKPRAAHRIEFEQAEPAPIRRLDTQGLLDPATRPTPVSGEQLVPTDALFTDDVVILDQLKSRSLIWGVPGSPRLRIEFPDSPYLGLWSKPGAPFLCIEPWHGIADPQGFTGDFTAKPGVFTVPPGGAQPIVMSITWLPE